MVHLFKRSSRRKSIRKRHRKSAPFGWKGYRFSLTTPGWFFFVLMILIGGAAVASGHNLLYLVVCLFFGSFIVMGNVAVMNLKALEVERIVPEYVYANTRSPVEIQVSNPRRVMDSFALEVRETTGRNGKPEGKVFLPLVEKEKEATAVYQLNLPNRGWYEFKGLEIMTRFPFGFWNGREKFMIRNGFLFFRKFFELGRRRCRT